MSQQAVTQRRYGTFLGVFTPSILTMLGAVMFLRFGWVVGNAGVYVTILMVVLANLITLVTAFSVSSLATAQRVGSGGVYFIISRSLGVEMGGAIGLPLYLAQVFTLTLYCFAFAEFIQVLWPGLSTQFLAAVFVVLTTVGSEHARFIVKKYQVLILATVGLSIFSLFLGVDWQAPMRAVKSTYTTSNAQGFWQVFSVFFPAVTGILTGLSLSGDLKDAQKSLPWGMISAVCCGFILYLIIPLALARHSSLSELRENSMVWSTISASPYIMFPGIIFAIVANSVGTILAASKTLKALINDGVISDSFGFASFLNTKKDIYISGFVAMLAILLGDLNTVASVITILLLTTYCVVNFVAGLEGVVSNPSFRPRIHIRWGYCAIGALGCFCIMLVINPLASMVALLIESLVYFYISRRTLKRTWGDLRGGFMMAVSRWALLAYKHMEEHRRNWRPHILVFSSELSKNIPMIQLASDLSMGRGIVTVAQLRTGNTSMHNNLRQEAKDMDTFLCENGIEAFCEVDLVHDIPSGIVTVAQANGIAGLQSNTVMMGWPSSRVFPVEGARVIRSLDTLEKSLIMTRFTSFDHTPEVIDVWWSGTYENGDLMLLLAHLLIQCERWQEAKIYLKTAVEDPTSIPERQGALEKICRETRINACCEVLQLKANQSINSIIVQHSRHADLVILGLSLPKEGLEEEYGDWYTHLVDGLDNVMLVRNSGPFRGKLIVEN
jgi:solute carrier family 12 (potassium/chloride transporter), member 4/6